MRFSQTREVYLALIFFFILLLPSCSFSQTHLKKILFTPSDEIFANPECGMYSVLETGLKPGKVAPYDPLNPEWLFDIREKHSLLFRYFGLKEWRTRDLPPEALSKISEDFVRIRKAGLKSIIRFAYSANIGEPDASLTTVLRHLDQLAPIIRANKDIVAVMQVGFIGAWGEWHSSTNDLETPENMRAVLDKVLKVLPTDRMVQLRYPYYKQKIFFLPYSASGALTPDRAFDGSPLSRVGHHNDCFLANESDKGTYTHDNYLDTAEAKAYIGRETRYVPMGGETCEPSSFSECQSALHELARLHWSFLNGDYDERVLADFERNGCMTEIRRKLGYRFTLRSAEFTPVVNPKGKFIFKAWMVNTGWASPYNRRSVELVFRHEVTSHEVTADTYVATLPDDPRYWLSGDSVLIEVALGIPPAMRSGKYSLFLNLPDPEPLLKSRPSYSIRLANATMWDSATGYNRLYDSVMVVNDVRAVENYRGSMWLQRAR